MSSRSVKQCSFPLVVASQAVGARDSLQARSLSGSPICSSQSMMHSLERAMAFRQHFETLVWKQSPLHIVEWKALKWTVKLSTHATIFSTVLQREANSFCLGKTAYTHPPKEWEEERKRKEERKKVGEKEGGKERKREIKGILHISECQESIWVMSIAERIRITFPETQKHYS